MERAAYRIIDANFNRAREALRVVEEYCRFMLNSASLSSRAKQIRHRLSGTINRLDVDRMLTCRDTYSDVGAGRTVPNELVRENLNDCLTAAFKRLTEALRTLAELIRMQEESVAQAIEKIRYEAYILEKDILLYSRPAEKFKRIRLYIIITSNLPVDILSLTSKCSAGGADCIQLRAKDVDDDRLYAVAVEFVKLCRDANVISIINDRIDIAVATGADGVHLGQSDLPIACVSKLQLSPLIVGKSTHSLKQLKVACKDSPTYIGLGPVFSTGTKPFQSAVGLDYIREATEILAGTGIGHVAIGGITPDNIEDVLGAGAESIAVCSAVANAGDPTAACRMLKETITNFRGQSS